MALSTVGDLEKFIQVDITNDTDAAVLLLIDFAQATIETYCDRLFEEVPGFIETLDGRGDEVLFLSQWPVTTLTSVVEDGDTLVLDTDHYFYPDGRIARGSPDAIDRLRWSRGRQNVVVTYTYGYAAGSIPVELVQASTRLASRMFQAGEAYANAPVGSSGIRTISLDGSDSVEYSMMIADVAGATDMLSPIETTLLSPHRRYVL